MRMTYPFSVRLTRRLSLSILLTLLASSLVLEPLQRTTAQNALLRAPSQIIGSNARRVNATAPQPGPPPGKLPSLDQLRKPVPPRTPAPIPSTSRRYRSGQYRAQLQTPRGNSVGAASPILKRSRPRSSHSHHAALLLPQSGANFPMARINPMNRTGTGGEDLLSNNFNWNLPLVGLKGRGLDLELTLSYNSLVWIRSGNYIDYDIEEGSMAPGFRLGFPTVEGPYWNDQTNTYFYLLVMPSGGRVELRYTGGNAYEAKDSSYLQLLDYTSSLLVRSTDGTQLNFVSVNGSWRCNQIKDRNGNYQTITYNGSADIANITDTLGRVLTFNYDGYGNILSITQVGRTQPWATFAWGTTYIGNNFPSLTNWGPVNTTIPVLTRVGLPDGSAHEFYYNGAGQVMKVARAAADGWHHSYSFYDYNYSGDDCPRIIQRRDWATNWSDQQGVPNEVTTYFTHDADGGCRMTLPDGTVYKEFYGSSWQAGLTTETRSYATVADANANIWQKRTTAAWTQDNTSVSYLTNPRPTETVVYDVSGNRRRTTVGYQTFTLPSGASCSLASEITEFANAVDVLRRTQTFFGTDWSSYLDRRIIGLPWLQLVFDGNGSLVSKRDFHYDWGGGFMADQGAAVQHDPNYGSGFMTRGNLVLSRQFDVSDPNNNSLTHDTRIGYNSNGSVIFNGDASWHTTIFNYTDSFSDNVNRNTFAYPTAVTDPDGFSSSVKYQFESGAVTRTQGPSPAAQSQGVVQTIQYDDASRITRMTTENNGAYTRYIYGVDYVESLSSINNVADEAFTFQYLNGNGQVFVSGGNHPGSSTGYKAQVVYYDVMGRVLKQSNPAEINGSWAPAGDDAAGWVFNNQTYDWKSRPLVTTHPDGTQKYASYAGCGCAGGEVITLTDEMGRQQKVYSDVVGRQWKTEALNWNGTVYSATTNTFNARNQVTLVRQFAGPEGSGTYHEATMSYDGYGRLQSKHVPEQSAGTATVYAYNPDDTISSVTDARGATVTYVYNNNRHLVKGLNYTAPPGVTPTSNVTFNYDPAGNRTLMTDGLGSTTYTYNQLSQLTAETRYINALGNSYTLSYSYNLAGELQTVTDPFGGTVTSSYDSAGRLKGVNGPNPGNPQYPTYDYVRDIKYRAPGDYKRISYGNNMDLDLDYNARLKITKFKVGGLVEPYYGQGATYVLMAQSIYDYYADGTVQGVRFTEGGGYANTYSYDHVSRAQTGSHYLNYLQNYGYDVWDNLTSRTGSYYGVGRPPYSATYVHNRNTAWGYDQDGNMTSDGQRQYSYDAANRTIFVSGLNVSQISDGDGRVVKVTNNGVTSHYVRSTVISDQIVTELNSQGARKVRYVYANGRLLAELVPHTGIEEIFWVHENPVTSERMLTAWCGINVRQVSFDALGNAVENNGYANTCYSSEPDPTEELMQTSWDAMYGDSNNSATGCYVDGIETSCSTAAQIVNVRRGVELPPGMSADVFQAVPNGGGFAFAVLSPFGDGLRADVIVSDGPLGYNLAAGYQLALGPQKPNEDVIDLVNRTLANPDCAEFLRAVLNKASTKSNPVMRGGDVKAIFQDFLAQTNGGISREKVKGARYGSASGTIRADGKGNAVIYRGLAAHGSQDEYDAKGIVAELPHLAGSKGGWPRPEYHDLDLARAAFDAGYNSYFPLKSVPNPFDTHPDRKSQEKNRYSMIWSTYFHVIMDRFCEVPKAQP